MLELKKLNKSFGKKKVLNDLSFQFEHGIYGLLGPNGAGKTTMIRCVTRLYDVPKGAIFYNGAPIEKSKNYLAQIGYLPQGFGMFKELSVMEMLALMANMKGIERSAAKGEIEKAVERVNLSEELHNKVGNLSGGMVRRLGVAQALLGDPEILIFDEPTAGLDPEERLRFKNLIAEIRGERTIIVSTHIVEDVESLCDYVTVMGGGKILASGSCSEIEQYAEKKVFVIPEDEINHVKEDYFVQKHVEQDGVRKVRVLSPGLSGYTPVSPNVEDGYICILKGI